MVADVQEVTGTSGRKAGGHRLPGALLILAGLLLCAVGFGIHTQFRQAESQAEAVAQEKARDLTRQAAAQIDARLRKLEGVVASFADELSRSRPDRDAILARIADETARNPDLFGFGIAFRPNAFDPAQRLLAPFSVRGADGRHTLVDIGAQYDYTAPSVGWYNGPMSKGRQWIEPYFGAASKTLVATHAMPFRLPGSTSAEPDGIVFANFSLDDIKNFVRSLNLGNAGYGYILSRQGTYLSFPIPDFVTQQRTVRAVAEERGDNTLRQAADAVEASRPAILDATNLSTGQASWFLFEPISATGWSMGATVIKDELRSDLREARRAHLTAAACILSGLVVLGVGVALFRRLQFRGWVWMAGVATVLLLGGVVLTLRLATVLPDGARDTGTIFNDPAALARYTALLDADATRREVKPPAIVPTGVYIETLRFTSGSEVSVTGTIWQKRPAGLSGRNDADIVFADAVSSRVAEATRRKTADGGEVITWQFDAMLRQRLELQKFPWDRADVAVRLRPRGLGSEVVFVPDLDSYRVVAPTAKAAVNQNLILPGWTVERSLFRIQEQPSLTSFGAGTSLYDRGAAQMVLEVGMRRDPTDPALSGLVPIVFLLAAVFAITVMSSHDKDRNDAFGQKPFAVVLSSSSLCFITTAGQTVLRSKVATDGLVYLEYFYMALYVIIVANAVNVILLARGRGGPLVTYGDNVIVRLGYWPCVMAIFFAFTLWRFF